MSELGEHTIAITQREEPVEEIKRGIPFNFFKGAKPQKDGIFIQTARFGNSSILVGKAIPIVDGSNIYTIVFELITNPPSPKLDATSAIQGEEGEGLVLFSKDHKNEFWLSQPEISEGGMRKIEFKLWHHVKSEKKGLALQETLDSRSPGISLTVPRNLLSETTYNFV